MLLGASSSADAAAGILNLSQGSHFKIFREMWTLGMQPVGNSPRRAPLSRLFSLQSTSDLRRDHFQLTASYMHTASKPAAASLSFVLLQQHAQMTVVDAAI